MNHSVLNQHFEKVPAFVAVARLGSLSKAANALAISQAALSQSMKKLEDVLETKLFIRSKIGIRLTDQGKILFEQGRKITEEIELVETRIRNDRIELKRIQIGTHEALATHFWPSVIEPFRSKHPNYVLSIISGRVDQIVQQVSNGDLDLALTVRPRKVSGIKTEVLYEDDLEFYVASQKLSPQKLTRKALSRVSILTDSQAHLAQGRSLAQALGELGLFSSSYFELNSFEAAARLAEKGVGIALLPKRIAGDLQSRFQLRKVTLGDTPKRVFKHEICLSYRKDPYWEQRNSSVIQFLKRIAVKFC